MSLVLVIHKMANMERKLEVYELILMRKSNSEIAQIKNIDRSTVYRIRKYFERTSPGWFDNLTKQQFVVECKTVKDTYEKVMADLWKLKEESTDIDQKLRILNSIVSTQKTCSEFVGAVPTVEKFRRAVESINAQAGVGKA
jgi:plasmid rolling circle replication initiator protein Rep